jgi:hypothetical protein
MALGGQEADRGALALEQRVGRDGRSVHDRLGQGEQPVQVGAELGGQESEPVDQTQRRVGRRRGALGDDERAELVDRDQVGEGAADVDADPVTSAQ